MPAVSWYNLSQENRMLLVVLLLFALVELICLLWCAGVLCRKIFRNTFWRVSEEFGDTAGKRNTVEVDDKCSLHCKLTHFYL